MHAIVSLDACYIENICEILFHHNIRKCVLFKERLFRANLRGVADKKFFQFRIANLYAYPR